MARKRTTRDEDISGRPKLKKALIDLYNDIEVGFGDQRDRADETLDYWDIYNCRWGTKQNYQGNAHIFLPIVMAAVDARKTRFVNQMFPRAGRYIEVVDENGEIPHGLMALAEHYIEKTKIRTEIAPAMCKNGDIEGQINLYVGWGSVTRHVVSRETKGLTIGGVEVKGVDDVEDINEETEVEEGPTVEVLCDSDILVLPTSADSIEDALESSGSVTIQRRWSKAAIRRHMTNGDIEEESGEAIIREMNKKNDMGRANQRKAHADAAGIKEDGKYCLVYETWSKLKVDGMWRLCRIYYGGDKMILGAKLCPYWNDRCPLISVPVEKVSGTFKGISNIKPCCDIQYYANDIINEAADSATYSMLPIIMTDPSKNPRVGSMVLDLAAVWETSPNDTKFASFPQLWKDGFAIAASAKQEIFQILSVNPAMISQSTGGKYKRNQAELATEQQVDILTTADAVTVMEQGVLTPMVQRFLEYDHQFRTSDILIKKYGMMGRRAAMERLPPTEMKDRFNLKWMGVEAARSAAQVQQQIAAMNVLRGIPPQMLPGRKVDLTPIVEMLVENTFGPRLSPLIFKDLKEQLSMPPEEENRMLERSFDVPTSPFDNDIEHVKAHMQLLMEHGGPEVGDPSGVIRVHLQRHQMQMQEKQQAQMAAQAPGQPGTPGGARPGIAGLPRPGAQPAQPRQGMQPAGAIRPDNMPAAGSVNMPRRM